MRTNVLVISLAVSTMIAATALLPIGRRSSSLSDLAKANIEALASVPEDKDCLYGGPNSIECESFITVETIDGNSYTYGCRTSCKQDEYACCNIIECTCVKY